MNKSSSKPKSRSKSAKIVTTEKIKQSKLPIEGLELSDNRTPSSKKIFQLKSELNRLQQRDREWKLMFQMLTHDLKEPLLTLEGFTGLMGSHTKLDTEQKRYMKVIREAVGSLHTMIGSLQSISKLYLEPEEYREISVNELMSNVVMTLSEQINRTGGRVVLPKEDVIVHSEPVRLYHIFLNLIANSLKFHRKDLKPEIYVTYRKDREFLRISIKDNGVGIEKKDLDKIFTPFARLDEVSTDGVGLGLSIVKRITDALGGKINVRSQQNKGTTFTVYIPRSGKPKTSSGADS